MKNGDGSSFKDFEAFYEYYESLHRNTINRLLHCIGTVYSICVVAYAFIASNPWFVALVLLSYVPAWIGHYCFERNVPATFGYAWWSLRANFRMFGDVIRNRRIAA